MGVGGKSQGRHYDYLKLDDLIGDKARDSKAEMQTAKDWIDNIQAFFTEFTRARWILSERVGHLMTCIVIYLMLMALLCFDMYEALRNGTRKRSVMSLYS